MYVGDIDPNLRLASGIRSILWPVRLVQTSNGKDNQTCLLKHTNSLFHFARQNIILHSCVGGNWLTDLILIALRV